MGKKKVSDMEDITQNKTFIRGKLQEFRKKVRTSQFRNEYIIRCFQELIKSFHSSSNFELVRKEALTILYHYRPQFYQRAKRMGWIK